MELTQEKLKTGIKNQMQNFLEGVYLTWRYDPYAPGVGDMRMQDDARTPGINPYGAKYVMRPETENLFVADYCDNNGGKKVEEAKIFLKESLAKVGEEISLLIDIIRVNEKHIPFDYNSTLKDNSRFTFKDNGMITLGNSLEGETPKIKNSTFGDSFGDM